MNPRLKMRGALVGAVVALTFALTWSLAKVPSLEDEVTRNASDNQDLRTSLTQMRGEVNANKKALDDANRKLIALGKAPVPVPPPKEDPPAPGLTASQLEAVRAVVVEVLGNAKVTQAQINQIARAAGKLAVDNLQVGLSAAVQAAVAAACADDRCVGKPGQRGPQGDRGPEGKAAPAITDEQLLTSATAALVTYCGAESKPCQGPQGVGVKEITCRDTDLMWVFTMTDGTTQLVRGPCRMVEETK